VVTEIVFVQNIFGFQIQMSEESFRLLDELGGFNIVPRGPVNLPKVGSTCLAYRSFCPRGRGGPQSSYL